MDLYFGTKKVNSNEQIGVRNTTLPIYFYTSYSRPNHYVLLIINVTKNELRYISGNYPDDFIYYSLELTMRPANVPFEVGKYGVYFFEDPPTQITEFPDMNLSIHNFKSTYPLSKFGKLVTKYAFSVVPSIITSTTFDLLFPKYLPIEIQRMIASNDLLSSYDIQEICTIATTKKINLCDPVFYETLARQRLNKSEKYWKRGQNTNTLQTLIALESKSMNEIIQFITKYNYPIFINKRLMIEDITIVDEFYRFLRPMIENVPDWAYPYYFNTIHSGRVKLDQLNILLEAVFPSNDGEGIDTTRFNVSLNSLEENDRVWDWIIQHLSDKDFDEGLEWIVTTGYYLSLLEKFLKYLSVEDQAIYLEKYRQQPLMVDEYDLRTHDGLVGYLRDILGIDNDTLREHGLI